MSRLAALVVCAFFASWAGPSRAEEPAPAGAAEKVPSIFHQSLRPNALRESFVSQIMGEFRQAAQGGTKLDRDGIDAAKTVATARLRGSLIGSLLAFDLDDDGVIDAGEASRATAGQAGRNLPPELVAKMLQNVMKYDLNGDQKIDADELRAAGRQTPGTNIDRGGRDAARLLVLADASGALGAAELTKAAERAFDAVDTDGDTVISPQEYGAFRKAAGLPEDRALLRASRALQLPPPSPTKREADEEIYLVGIYEGFTGETGAPHGPRALVGLDRPGKKVTLILCSYEGVRWSVTTTPGTELKELKTLPSAKRSEVFVNDALRQPDVIGGVSSCPYEAKGRNFRNAVAALAPWTGFSKLDGFAGSYSASKSGYVIDKPIAQPEFKPVYLKPVPLEGLPAIRFGATLRGVPGVYDLAGVLVEKGPRADGRRSVDVPARKERYEVDHDSLKVTVGGDPASTKDIPVSLDVPDISWPCGIAYDGKRKRLVIVTFGGEGFVYEYLIETGKWRVLASMRNSDVSGLAYDEKTDLLWTLDGGSLMAMNADGKKVRSVRPNALPGFYDTLDPGNETPSISLATVQDGQAVLVMTGGQKHRVYLVDLTTGNARLTGVGE